MRRKLGACITEQFRRSTIEENGNSDQTNVMETTIRGSDLRRVNKSLWLSDMEHVGSRNKSRQH